MKNNFLFLALLLLSSKAFTNEVCESIFKVRYPGKLKKVASKTATNNYSRLKSSLKTLQTKGIKISLGTKQVSPQNYLKNIQSFYTGKPLTKVKSSTNYFDDIDEVFASIKQMGEEQLTEKLQASMKRYAASYNKTYGKVLKIPGSGSNYALGKDLNDLFHSSTKGSKSDFKKYLDGMLFKDPNTNKADLLRSELMSWYGQELNLFYEPLIDQIKRESVQTASGNSVTVTKAQIKKWQKRTEYIEEVKEAKYKISRAINRFEQFKANQVTKVGIEDFVMTKNSRLSKNTVLELDDYETYTRGLLYDLSKKGTLKRINGKKFKIQKSSTDHKNIRKMYSDIDEGNLGILDLDEYRDVVSKNTFPMFAKRHDMRHIHYAISHPRALGAMMGATRSQNHVRFAQLGGMYEAIETVQYSFESSIAQYFSKDLKNNTFLAVKRNLDLEESMLTLATTPRVFSFGIGEAHGYGYHWKSVADELKGWTPKTIVKNIGETSETIILDGSLRMKRGVKDGEETFTKVAKIKQADGSFQEMPVYLKADGSYSSYSEVDPNMMSLNEDIEQMVNKFQERFESYQTIRANITKRANEQNKFWYEVMTEEEEIIFHLYNYQKNPESAAVKVAIKNSDGQAVSDISYINDQMLNADGVKWKNDGRAHYDGDGTTGEFGFGSGTND